MPEFFAYVEFKERKFFRKDKAEKHGEIADTDDGRRANANVLYDDAWQMQQSGGSLLLVSKKSGARYACPWSDVRLALFPAEMPPKATDAKKAAG